VGVTNPGPSLSAEAEISDVCRRSNDVRQVQIRLTPRSGACVSVAGSETGMLCNSVVVEGLRVSGRFDRDAARLATRSVAWSVASYIDV
jgi:hypothetical protein